MKKFGVWVTYKQCAYVEVEAEDEEEAEQKGFDKVDSGEGQPYGSEDDFDIEVEEIE